MHPPSGSWPIPGMVRHRAETVRASDPVRVSGVGSPGSSVSAAPASRPPSIAAPQEPPHARRDKNWSVGDLLALNTSRSHRPGTLKIEVMARDWPQGSGLTENSGTGRRLSPRLSTGPSAKHPTNNRRRPSGEVPERIPRGEREETVGPHYIKAKGAGHRRPAPLSIVLRQTRQGIVVPRHRKTSQETPEHLHLDPPADLALLLRGQDQGRQPRPLQQERRRPRPLPVPPGGLVGPPAVPAHQRRHGRPLRRQEDLLLHRRRPLLGHPRSWSTSTSIVTSRGASPGPSPSPST